MVEQPLELDLDELLRLPARELSAVFECYGNPLEPDSAARSVANVVWLEGLDSGTFAGTYCERYAKDIPVARALNDDVLVAYAMNGEPLTAEHGAPVRIVVPGYFGTSSVKWLSRVTLAAARPEGLFTTRLYNRRVEGREHTEPAQELDVNAVIVRPCDEDRLAPGRHLISGWAWSASEITRVEVNTDQGASWQESHVVAREPAPTWQRFGFEWDVATPGVYEIRARATDSRGRVQPNRGRNAVHAVSVTVAP
jgi:sulfane dehydrogenase subunit SoxC